MTGTIASLSQPSYMVTVEHTRRRAHRRILQEGPKTPAIIPDPREYAQRLQSRYVVMLLSASLREFWSVTPEAARELRPLGLCEYGGNCLTAFGIFVRRELKAMDA